MSSYYDQLREECKSLSIQNPEKVVYNYALRGKEGYRLGIIKNFNLRDGKGIYSLADICFGGLSGNPNSYFRFFTDWDENDTRDTVEEIFKYGEWLINHSHMADCFITKDMQEFYQIGCLMSSKVSAPEQRTAAQLLRTACEYRGTAKIWNELCEERVEPHVALALALTVQTLPYNHNLISCSSSHRPINTWDSEEETLSFKERGLKTEHIKTLPPVEKAYRYVNMCLEICGEKGTRIKFLSKYLRSQNSWGCEEVISTARKEAIPRMIELGRSLS